MYSGTFSPAELRQYFDEVGFYMDDQDWRDYGLGYTADVKDASGLGIDIVEGI